MKFKKSEIKKILLISLTNVGDVVLTFPVIDILKQEFPSAQLSLLIGPKAESLFSGNPHFKKVYTFHKQKGGLDKFFFMLELRQEKFDLVVDLRNTAIPFLINGKYRTSPRVSVATHPHMRIKHLNRLRSVVDFDRESQERFALVIPPECKKKMDQLLKNNIDVGEALIAVGAGAAHHNKRWTKEGFAAVCDQLIEHYHKPIVFVGDQSESSIARDIQNKMRHETLNLCGQTSLIELSEVLTRATLVLVNDSAIMHLASYLNIPTVALFGPTDEKKYGPWGARSIAVRKKVFCSACEKSDGIADHICMKSILPDDVTQAIHKIYQK